MFKTQLDHLTMLWREPAWKAHAWHRAKELEANSELFTGMAAALTLAIRGPEKATESGHPTVTKTRSAGPK